MKGSEKIGHANLIGSLSMLYQRLQRLHVSPEVSACLTRFLAMSHQGELA